MAVAAFLSGLMPSSAEAQFFSSPNWPGVYPGRTPDRFDGLPERPVRRRAVPSYPKLIDAPKNDQKPQGPLVITVSLDKQWLKIYDERGLFAESPISSGTKTHPTPMGVFSILEKSKWHRSNLYSSAPMPFMQRITWSGVALHAGELPGYPASHGCIRLPAQFAARLWNWTKRGARVIITPGEMSIADVSHKNLVAQLPSTVAAVPAPDRISNVRTADASNTLSAGIKSDASKPTVFTIDAALRGSLPKDATAKAVTAEPKTETAEPKTETAAPKVADIKAADAKLVETTPPDINADKKPATEPLIESAGNSQATQEPASAGVESEIDTGNASEEKSAEVEVNSPEKAPEAAAKTDTPAAKIENAKSEETKSEVIKSENTKTEDRAAAIPEPAKDEARAPAAEASVEPQQQPVWMQLPKRSGQVAVLISRKDGKLYMRQNFDPVFEVPVSFASDGPIGTHVFTVRKAINDDTAFEWTAVTLPGITKTIVSREPYKTPKGKMRMRDAFHTTFGPPPVTASEALDRIAIPEEALQRIAYNLSPGSSIVVSDQSFSAGGETGRGTEFIVPLR